MKTAHLEVDVQTDVCPPDSPGGTQNEEGDENRASDAGIKRKLVTWLALAAFVVAAVAVTALAGSSVPSTLLREHPRSESEGRELARRYGGMSMWMDNILGGEWDIEVYMNNRKDDVVLRSYQTRYVSKPRSPRSKRKLDFQVSNLPASKDKTKLIIYDIDTDAGAVTYKAIVSQRTIGVSNTVVYISTFASTAPSCREPYYCDCRQDERQGSKYVWACFLDFKNGSTTKIKVTAV